MFTGIVETTGAIEAIDTKTGRMRIRTPLAAKLHMGESIAVDGACLTVVGRRRGSFDIDVSPETFARTSFGILAKGTRVNLERALSAGGRMEGHFVMGHVDGTGRFVSRRDEGEFARYRFAFKKALARYLIPKGSVSVQGVSLTIASLQKRSFDVALIPYTLDVTNLADLEKGHLVNLEVDMIGKYVIRYMETRDE